LPEARYNGPVSERDKTLNDPVRTRLGVGDTGHRQAADLVETVVLDRYLVEAELGAGAMGTVYRGSDLQTHRGVAIKVMHKHLGHEPVMIARFAREARVAARLRHENVVGVLDAGTHRGSPVMVQELAIGPTLRAVLGEQLPPARTLELVTGILHGLEHAHTAKLIHRDLKPENVIVEMRDGREIPRILDFGIAALADKDESLAAAKLTATGVVIGTPMYMAPELAMGEAIDHRIDLFALGVMFYEMLAGGPPFSGSMHEIVLANVHKDPAPIASADPLLDLLARKLMARAPAKRIASARVALDLIALIARDPAAAALELGRMDAARATSVIGLPDP
jgi:serine/threonine-protein kinase